MLQVSFVQNNMTESGSSYTSSVGGFSPSPETNHPDWCEYVCFCSGVDDLSIVLGSDTCLFVSWHFEALWWSYMQGSEDPKVVLTLENETMTVSQNVGNHMPSDTMSIPRGDTSSWLLSFMVFIISSRQMWGRYFLSDNICLLHHVFQFALYWSSYCSTRRSWTTDSIIK